MYFYSKNKFEKSIHLVGFITRIYNDARSPECQNVFQGSCHLVKLKKKKKKQKILKCTLVQAVLQQLIHITTICT